MVHHVPAVAADAAAPASGAASTVVRLHVTGQELCTLDGLVALPHDTLIELPDRTVGRVVGLRLVVGDTSRSTRLLVDIQRF